MTGFDTVVVVDWSARATPSPARPSKDAIFLGICRDGYVATLYQRTRSQAMRNIRGLIDGDLRAGRRILLAFDFPFAYPNGLAENLAGDGDPLEMWAYLTQRIEDDDRNGNNRFEVAAALNGMFGQDGPFWGHPVGVKVPGLPFRKPSHDGFPFSERRRIETLVPRAKTCFQLMGAGSVGSQALLGIARLQGLRERYGAAISVAPFEEPETQVVLAECYPGLFADMIAAHTREGEIPDRAQVRVLAHALSRLAPDRLDPLLREGDRTEGWILGHGAEAELEAALP
jgi:molybdopterin molybdotransferase